MQFPVCIMWEEYACETKVDLATLFEQFDPTWSSRNKQDLVGAHLGVHEDLLQTVSRHVATHATGGVQWYREKAEGYTSTAESQFTLIHENHEVHDFLMWCGQTLSKEKTPELMHPRATMAAIFHCLRDPNPEVRAFWKRVAAGKPGNDAETIEYKLAAFLELTRTCKVASDWPKAIQRHLKLNKQRPSDKDIFATCLRACGAAIKGQKVGEVFTPAKKLSVPQLIADLYPLPLPAAA